MLTVVRTCCVATVLVFLRCVPVAAQEATAGISVPATITGEVRRTTESGEASTVKAGFRAVLSPSVRLGPHWFIYALLDADSSSYLPYSIGPDTDTLVHTYLSQAFAGYMRDFSRGSMLIKAGRLSSAFGLYPVEYDDAKTPLIRPPLPYTTNLPLRPDQVSCGVSELVWQPYGDEVTFHCGGSTASRYGLTPVTLYGVPGIESQFTIGRVDARLQMTNSSPANPQSLLSDSQRPQWTAGGGYSFHNGLHLGISTFRGPYLETPVARLLRPGSTLHSFPANGVGVEARWSHGQWSAQGEWFHFTFGMPGFATFPSETAVYGELKRIISPRMYIAARANSLSFGAVRDQSGATATHSSAPQQLYEIALGYRFNRMQLLKVGTSFGFYEEWSSGEWYWPPLHRNTAEIALVTSLPGFSKPFK